MADQPPSDSDEMTALRTALAEAVSLLAAVDSDANNVQIDIARWRRRHHRVVRDESGPVGEYSGLAAERFLQATEPEEPQ